VLIVEVLPARGPERYMAAKRRGDGGSSGTAIPQGLLAPFAQTRGWEIEQKGYLCPNNLAMKIPAWFHK